jgi:hypothetical protein
MGILRSYYALRITHKKTWDVQVYIYIYLPNQLIIVANIKFYPTEYRKRLTEERAEIKLRTPLDHVEQEPVYIQRYVLKPIVKEGAQQRQHSEIQTEFISGRKSQGGLDAKTYWLTDRQS